MSNSAPKTRKTRPSLPGRLRNLDDRSSWEEFLRTYRPLLYSVSKRAGLTHTEAEDVVQRVVSKVAEKIGAFDYDPKVGSFTGWLLKMTRWRIIDELRDRIELLPSAPPGASGPRTGPAERIAAPPSFDAIWDEEWLAKARDLAEERIRKQAKPRQYQIYDCYVNRQWPVSRVVESLGVSKGQVYLAKTRIGALIRDELKNLERSPL